MNRSRRLARGYSAALVFLLVFLSACGTPTSPSPPPPPPPNTAPVVDDVTANKSQVETGQEVEVTATAHDKETAVDLLQYTWRTNPQGGTFQGTGKTVRWTPPADGPVPTDYIISVTVADAGGLTATGSTRTPVRVNDANRELQQLALGFLSDFTDVTKDAVYCVRNFTDSCPGKRDELSDITRNRVNFDQIVNVTPPAIKSIQQNSGYIGCTYPSSLGGRPACSLIVTGVDWRSRWSRTNTFSQPPGTWEHVVGDAILTGVYERQQWWLCDSYFSGSIESTFRAFLR